MTAVHEKDLLVANSHREQEVAMQELRAQRELQQQERGQLSAVIESQKVFPLIIVLIDAPRYICGPIVQS